MDGGQPDARAIIAIRTHQWTEQEERLLSALSEVTGHDVAVVFHARRGRARPPVDVIELDDAWLAANGLAAVADWGWRCGDYFYYRLREARPDHAFYWLIEPDVHFTASPDDFFARFADEDADAMGYALGPFTRSIPFTRGLPGLAHHQALFALTRLSGRALDRLVALRRAYSASSPSPRFFTNDEIFVFSNVAADPELASRRLEDVAPDWFQGARFAPSPDMLLEMVDGLAPDGGRVLHPVHGRASFKRATAARLAPPHAFLRNIRAEVNRLDDAEIDEIVEQAAGRLRAELQSWRRAARRERQGGT